MFIRHYLAEGLKAGKNIDLTLRTAPDNFEKEFGVSLVLLSNYKYLISK